METGTPRDPKCQEENGDGPTDLQTLFTVVLYTAKAEQTFKWTLLATQYEITVSHDVVKTEVMGYNGNVLWTGLELPKPQVWTLGYRLHLDTNMGGASAYMAQLVEV